MTDKTVKLGDDEWQQVMNILIQAHPLLMKIANQLREQTPEVPPTNSQEMPENKGEVRRAN